MVASLVVLGSLLSVSKFVAFEPIPMEQVQIHDRFWAPKIETNRKISLIHSLDMLEKSGNIKNFELAASQAHQGYTGPVFMDSDLYKTLEAVSLSLATHPDRNLQERVEGVIQKIASAQMPDGYLDTYYQVNEPKNRLTNLAWNHELYCAGHLIEAAVAHYKATKTKSLLDVATKYADFLCRTFGDKPGQREGYGGHPEIELALVKLWKVTGSREYFDLAQFFIMHRGEGFFAKEQHIPIDKYDGKYYQDNLPICDQTKIVGHAVRAGYLMSGATDIAMETGNEKLKTMLDRVWANTTEKNMYLTGGIGPSASNEGFTFDYDLPNLTAYQETCASVAMVLWDYRMGLMHGDSKYFDAMERSLYNGVISGVSLDGLKFFYVNPLASTGNHHRSEWFSCACCPPNVARTLAGLGGYMFAKSESGIVVNLFADSSLQTVVGNHRVGLETSTNYPWDGRVRFKVNVERPQDFGISLRKPGWCNSISLKINGKPIKSDPSANGYLELTRTWSNGDKIELDMDMTPRQVMSNPSVQDNRGKLALMRGPIVYCFEQTDNSDSISTLSVPFQTAWKSKFEPNLLNGVVVLSGYGQTSTFSTWPGGLYREAQEGRTVQMRAIPYYAWDNRKPGEMAVWMPTSPQPPLLQGLEKGAKISASFVSSYAKLAGINDGQEPKSSGEQPGALLHFWPHKGGQEWIQYEWSNAIEVSRTEAYWFDDTGRGECRFPKSAHVEALINGSFQQIGEDFVIEPNTWCQINFPKVETNALRLVINQQEGWASGVHEWRIWNDSAQSSSRNSESIFTKK